MPKSLLDPTIVARSANGEDYIHELLQHNPILRRAIVLVLTVLSLAAFLAVHRSKLLEYKCQYATGLPQHGLVGFEQAPVEEHFIIISTPANVSDTAKDRWLGS
ncbi:hypothetical protein Daesc_002743 [Daldinia eschscholtzii]|uniref:Uncharacterized protein n=1 Tax=Daldinia eschscholtzii TaxID=292717 RepID=A0AAX6MRQ4_9PEZI